MRLNVIQERIITTKSLEYFSLDFYKHPDPDDPNIRAGTCATQIPAPEVLKHF